MHASITVELHAGGATLAAIQVPMKLTAGKLTNGVIPIHSDTADLTARITRGIEAFTAAVAD